MTAYGTIGAAVEATRLGAEDYLVKPFEPEEILLVLRRALEFRELRAQRRQSLRRNQERFTLTNLVAKSPKMLEIMALLREIAQLETTVLIHGETGVGKELLARTLHFAGPRRDKPFVAVNCAAIPEELFESELFGYRRGAFTGATEPRRGHFQLASGGALLLDEIGEMPLGLQSKLLRAIEEKKITPIGAERPIDIDVRFIATTNQDLQETVERGAFRRDLFYRLSVFPIRVPPLRERVEDIPPLAAHFLVESARRCKKNVRSFAPAALEALVRYPWPGNARELENLVERAVITAREDVIADVAPFLAPKGADRAIVDLTLPFRDAKARVVEEFERAYVAGVLGLHGGKLSAAARHAGMDNKNLWEKMVRYGLRSRAAAGEPPADASAP
jgi:DNA-binding NtrC family response regulator